MFLNELREGRERLVCIKILLCKSERILSHDLQNNFLLFIIEGDLFYKNILLFTLRTKAHSAKWPSFSSEEQRSGILKQSKMQLNPLFNEILGAGGHILWLGEVRRSPLLC